MIIIPRMFLYHETLFSFMLERYTVCDVCGLRSPSFESRVLYITPTYTTSTQELIMQGMQQNYKISCFRCKKNIWQEWNYILQSPKNLIIIANRFRYVNNNVTKDRRSILMTIMLGPPKI